MINPGLDFLVEKQGLGNEKGGGFEPASVGMLVPAAMLATSRKQALAKGVEPHPEIALSKRVKIVNTFYNVNLNFPSCIPNEAIVVNMRNIEFTRN